MPFPSLARSGVAGRWPARRPNWPMLALAVALVWCAAAKPAPKSDAPPPTGIPYQGMDAKQLKALAGTKVDLVPLKGKTINSVELIKLTPGKQPGTLQSVAFKSADGGPTRNLRAAAVARLMDGTTPYDVMPDRQHKGGFILIDVAARDKLVSARLKEKGDCSLWPVLSAEQRAEAVKENKKFLEKVRGAVGEVKFQLHETDYYLFYTDMPQANVAPVIADLDSMYLTLGQKFGVHEGENIWHGKAMIVVFATKDRFARFERGVMEVSDVADHQSFYHTFFNGDVLTACYVGDDPNHFIANLIRDTARSYMFRYRSNIYLPTWLGEGMTEWISASIVPNKQAARMQQERAAQTARTIGSLDGFFEAKNLKSWQWGVASSMADILIKTDAQAYRALIQGVKEGQTWEESLQDSYGLTRADLVQLYGDQIGVPNLRP
ncbi:MAG TPA: hypothetical protein VHY91_05835 [Pirellulales bacterium]|nr:hypothetical protein [Pirellulales bacterium]